MCGRYGAIIFRGFEMTKTPDGFLKFYLGLGLEPCDDPLSVPPHRMHSPYTHIHSIDTGSILPPPPPPPSTSQHWFLPPSPLHFQHKIHYHHRPSTSSTGCSITAIHFQPPPPPPPLPSLLLLLLLLLPLSPPP